jgi:hypothetical protein
MLQIAMANRTTQPLNIAAAHRHFSSDCFNKTWGLIEKADRTSDEDEEMVVCALASLWHWMQRTDHTNLNLSVGHWQVARVYSLVGQGEIAILHAKRSLELAEGNEPFYVGSAHEAVARAAAVLADVVTFQTHLKLAKAFAENVSDAGDRAVLEADLRILEGGRRESHY